MNTYWIGRGTQCHIQLADDSISRLHAELIVAKDGRYYLTDCASTHGTYCQQQQQWIPIRQQYINLNQPLRLGTQVTTLQALLQNLQPARQSPQRNPETGEILS